jgi:hypothetical protein
MEVEDWFTIVTDGAMRTTSLLRAREGGKVDASTGKLAMKCPGVDVLFHSRWRVFLGGSVVNQGVDLNQKETGVQKLTRDHQIRFTPTNPNLHQRRKSKVICYWDGLPFELADGDSNICHDSLYCISGAAQDILGSIFHIYQDRISQDLAERFLEATPKSHRLNSIRSPRYPHRDFTMSQQLLRIMYP